MRLKLEFLIPPSQYKPQCHDQPTFQKAIENSESSLRKFKFMAWRHSFKQVPTLIPPWYPLFCLHKNIINSKRVTNRNEACQLLNKNLFKVKNLMQNQLPAKPHHKIHIQGNWEFFAGMKVPEVRKYVLEHCQPFVGEEEDKFKDWFKNQKKIKKKQKSKNKSSNDHSSNQMIVSQIDKAMDIFDKQADHLLPKLSEMGKEDQIDFLREKLNENPFFIMQLLQVIEEAPCNDFLEILIQLCLELQQDIVLQTKLFIRVCAFHSTEKLIVNEQLIQNALIELSGETNDKNAAYGLLKLSYQNDISFKNFELDALIVFQERYQSQFKRFFDSLQQRIDFQVRLCLPQTCFLFTMPFYKLLKQRGQALHQRIIPELLPFFINLLAYSFEDNEENLLCFVNLFKHLSLQIYGTRMNLIGLLNIVTMEEIKRNPLFFGSLKGQLKLFQHLSDMIKEKIVDDIDDNLIGRLIQLNNDDYHQRSKQPKKVNSVNDLKILFTNYCSIFKEENPAFIHTNIDNGLELNHETSEILSLFGIQNLNFPQLLSLNIMNNLMGTQKIFQKFETGIGKTTLSLICMMMFSKINGLKCFTVYHSKELCLRDFMTLSSVSQKLNVKTVFISNENEFDLIKDASIVFINKETFQLITKYEDLMLAFSESVLLLDEFDQILFEPTITNEELFLYLMSKYLVAFTGSPMNEIHQHILRDQFKGVFLNYPLQLRIDGKENINKGVQLFDTRKKQLPEILKVCKEQVLQTPVLIILDQAGINQFIELGIKQLTLKDLTRMKPEEIEGFFRTSFLKKNGDKYYACLMSPDQARGLDPPSCYDIETNGGVTVIIGVMPRNIQQYEQFKGRTKRMGNKGQYHVIIWAKTNSSGQEFLDEQLETARIEEHLLLNNLSLRFQSFFKEQLQRKVEPEEQKKIEQNDEQIHINNQDLNKDEGHEILFDKDNQMELDANDKHQFQNLLEKGEEQHLIEKHSVSSATTNAGTRGPYLMENFRLQLEQPSPLGKRNRKTQEKLRDDFQSEGDPGSEFKIPKGKRGKKIIEKKLIVEDESVNIGRKRRHI